jgi:hypothetical protein
VYWVVSLTILIPVTKIRPARTVPARMRSLIRQQAMQRCENFGAPSPDTSWYNVYASLRRETCLSPQSTYPSEFWRQARSLLSGEEHESDEAATVIINGPHASLAMTFVFTQQQSRDGGTYKSAHGWCAPSTFMLLPPKGITVRFGCPIRRVSTPPQTAVQTLRGDRTTDQGIVFIREHHEWKFRIMHCVCSTCTAATREESQTVRVGLPLFDHGLLRRSKPFPIIRSTPFAACCIEFDWYYEITLHGQF